VDIEEKKEWNNSCHCLDISMVKCVRTLSQVTVGQVSLPVLWFSILRIITPVLHNHISLICHQRYIILATHSVVKWNTYLSISAAFFQVLVLASASYSCYKAGRSETKSHGGADMSLARPERKQATATEHFDFHISYL